MRHALFGRNATGCSSPGELHISSSPGRMDLMCGFADYSGSHAIQYPTAERVVSLAAVDDNTNFQSGMGDQGMIRLACIEVTELSELSRAVATGDFRVRETAFPTGELFTLASQLKSDAELRTTLSEKIATAIPTLPTWAAPPLMLQPLSATSRCMIRQGASEIHSWSAWLLLWGRFRSSPLSPTASRD